MLIFPNAKINIGLNIINRRNDGYHNIETVFYPLPVKDAIEVIKADKLGFTSSGIEIPGLQADNLCMKAYHLLKKDFDLSPIKIHIHKLIPIGAGLGGGSADAAFFIRLLNRFFDLSLDGEQMIGYARQLGADCAFFIRNEPIFAHGIGDEFEPVSIDLSAYHISLIMPPAHVSTAEAYRGIRPTIPATPLKDLIKLPIAQWKNHIKNDFEEIIFKNHPAIRGVKAALYDHGAIYASMSGSGASVFGIFKQKPDLSTLQKDNQVLL